MARKKLKFHTKMCDVLCIEYPRCQAGMGGFSDPPLVIAVSEAGGLGTLGGAVYEPDTLDIAIRQIRKGTSKPFAIDLLLPDSLKDMEGVSNGEHDEQPRGGPQAVEPHAARPRQRREEEGQQYWHV